MTKAKTSAADHVLNLSHEHGLNQNHVLDLNLDRDLDLSLDLDSDFDRKWRQKRRRFESRRPPVRG